jgi:integrase
MDEYEPLINVTKSYTTYDMKYLMMSFCYHIAPLRQSEICNLKYDCDDKKFNSVNTKTWKLYINNHKTCGKVTRDAYNIPKELQDILTKYKNGKLKNNEFVITNKKFKPLTTSYCTKLLNQIFGKGIGNQYIRKYFSTHQFNSTDSIEEVLQYAQNIGHDINTHVNDYLNIIPNENITSI